MIGREGGVWVRESRMPSPGLGTGVDMMESDDVMPPPCTFLRGTLLSSSFALMLGGLVKLHDSTAMIWWGSAQGMSRNN